MRVLLHKGVYNVSVPPVGIHRAVCHHPHENDFGRTAHDGARHPRTHTECHFVIQSWRTVREPEKKCIILWKKNTAI